MFTYNDNGNWIVGNKQHSNEWLPIVRDEDGNIVEPVGLKEQIEAEAITQVQTDFRTERNRLLSEVDIMINKAEDNGEDTTALRAYRQALRDATIDWIMPTLEA